MSVLFDFRNDTEHSCRDVVVVLSRDGSRDRREERTSGGTKSVLPEESSDFSVRTLSLRSFYCLICRGLWTERCLCGFCSSFTVLVEIVLRPFVSL